MGKTSLMTFAPRFNHDQDLGFGPTDRIENIRRIGEVSLLFSSSATLTITAFISPYVSDRQLARKLHEDHKPSIRFIEVFVDAPLSVVEKRDPKGLYQKARAGEIKGESSSLPPRRSIDGRHRSPDGKLIRPPSVIRRMTIFTALKPRYYRVYRNFGTLRSAFEPRDSYPNGRGRRRSGCEDHRRLP